MATEFTNRNPAQSYPSMAGAQNALTPPREISHTEMSLKHLSEAGTSLAMSIDTLESRLAPALSPEPKSDPSPNAAAGQRPRMPAELPEEIMQNTDSIQAQVNRLGRIIARLALVFLFCVGIAHAQTNVAAPPTFHFVAGGSAIGFSGAGASGMQAGSVAYTGLQLTNTLTFSYEHLSVPNINYRAELGVASYTRALNAILGSKLASKFLFDTSNINVTFSGGAGKAFANKSGIAETVGASISYPIPGTSAAVQIIGYQYVHGAGVGGLVQRNQQVASTGLIVYF